MAMKRYAEYRHIGNPSVAAAYRASFAYYTEERLLISLFFYATSCALFAGIFVVRYHPELILFAPLCAGLFAYYMKLGLQPDSPVQNPEKLYKQTGFLVYMIVCTVVFILLMFTSIPRMATCSTCSSSVARGLWEPVKPGTASSRSERSSHLRDCRGAFSGTAARNQIEIIVTTMVRPTIRQWLHRSERGCYRNGRVSELRNRGANWRQRALAL